MWLAIRLFAVTGVLGGVLFSGTASLGEEKSPQVGDTVSEFKILDDQDRIWNSRDHIGKKLVVVYFYPSDFAFCCTRQAQRYRDKQRELANFDVELIGVSGDTIKAHRMFKETHLLNHTLLSDTDGSVPGSSECRCERAVRPCQRMRLASHSSLRMVRRSKSHETSLRPGGRLSSTGTGALSIARRMSHPSGTFRKSWIFSARTPPNDSEDGDSCRFGLHQRKRGRARVPILRRFIRRAADCGNCHTPQRVDSVLLLRTNHE